MKNLLKLMLCFSLLLFISNGVNAIDRDHSPPGISCQYDMPEGVLVAIFTIENHKIISAEPVINPVAIFKPEVKRGGLYALRLWRQDSKCVINNPSFSDNSLYAFNHLLYETSISENCNQWTKSVNKHGTPGIETAFLQDSQLSLYD